MTCGAIAGSVTARNSRGPLMPRSRATRKNTLGMFATAALVERTMGKNAAMKIRKMAGGSPMPSQRMANGIHASGERLLKKFTIGRNASRAPRRVSQHQSGRYAKGNGEQKTRRHAEQRRDGVVDQAAALQLHDDPARHVPRVRKKRWREETGRGHSRPDQHQGCGRDDRQQKTETL
jgi:hypothetical protein